MKYTLYTDGGARGNPGPGGIGIVLYQEKEIIYEGSKYIGKCTNNEAEYMALIAGLTVAQQKNIKEIESYLDSELIVKQLNKEYKVKNERLNLLYEKVISLVGSFDNVAFKHVKREKNKKADALVNEALDKNGY